MLCAGSKSILVVDIGGGTTDVTITAIKDHTLSPSVNQTPSASVEVTVMATAGHSQVSCCPSENLIIDRHVQCGGRDVDNLFAWYISGQLLSTYFAQQYGTKEITLEMITPEVERKALLGVRQLTEKCRTAKVSLFFEILSLTLTGTSVN